jgi:hypothetical protein
MMIESLHSSGTNTAKMINFFRAHTRGSVITITSRGLLFALSFLFPIGARDSSIFCSSPPSS